MLIIALLAAPLLVLAFSSPPAVERNRAHDQPNCDGCSMPYGGE